MCRSSKIVSISLRDGSGDQRLHITAINHLSVQYQLPWYGTVWQCGRMTFDFGCCGGRQVSQPSVNSLREMVVLNRMAASQLGFLQITRAIILPIPPNGCAEAQPQTPFSLVLLLLSNHEHRRISESGVKTGTLTA